MKPGDAYGHFVAINPLTGQKKWEVPLTDFPSSAGMLATGGGLVFTGKLTGEFIALDEDTGKTLWQFKTGSSINSTAITYTHNGRQYVTIASGLGGGLANRYARRQGADRRIGLDVRADAVVSVAPQRRARRLQCPAPDVEHPASVASQRGTGLEQQSHCVWSQQHP